MSSPLLEAMLWVPRQSTKEAVLAVLGDPQQVGPRALAFDSFGVAFADC